MKNSLFLLKNQEKYLRWRQQKLQNYPHTIENLMVEIQQPERLTTEEYQTIIQYCQQTNMAVYDCSTTEFTKNTLKHLAQQLGLNAINQNLCADEDAISSLKVQSQGQGRHALYIPYSNKPLSWHTDGYYNTKEQTIYSWILHCVRPAEIGGDNTLLDYERVYIALRDENPNWIPILMRNNAMTIPANIENGIEIRPAQTGPVFSIHPQTGRLHMRYSARQRHIIWHPDAKDAVDFITDLLSQPLSYKWQYKLKAGQGIISNNVLHNRQGFKGEQRLLYRARYYQPIQTMGI